MDRRTHRQAGRLNRLAGVVALALVAGCASAPPVGSPKHPEAASHDRPATARRTVIFSEELSANNAAPHFVELDSGIAYRLTAQGSSYGAVLVAPSTGASPIRFLPTATDRGLGTGFIAPYTGRYRVYTEGDNTTMLVRIVKEEGDAQELRCLEDPTRSECRQRRGHTPWLFVALLTIPIVLLALTNENSF